MKHTVLILTLTALILMGESFRFSAKVVQPALPVSRAIQPVHPVLIDEILLAHGLSADASAFVTTSARAIKSSYYQLGSESEAPDFFERLVVVDRDGVLFKRSKITPQGLRKQIDLFDGQNAYRYEIEEGNSTGRLNRVEDSQYQSVNASVTLFGLLPIINLLQDATTEIISIGRAEGLDIVSMKTDSGIWTLYADQEHLIRKVERGQIAILFADYRTVEAVQLPFKQSLYLGGRLTFDLSFIQINLHPVFSPDYFSQSSLQQEDARLNNQ
jgi:hypothetical protein